MRKCDYMRCWAGLYDAQEDTLNGSENKFAMRVITITDDESMQYGVELYASGYANPPLVLSHAALHGKFIFN